MLVTASVVDVDVTGMRVVVWCLTCLRAGSVHFHRVVGLEGVIGDDERGEGGRRASSKRGGWGGRRD
jgi:hypothetical protein